MRSLFKNPVFWALLAMVFSPLAIHQNLQWQMAVQTGLAIAALIAFIVFRKRENPQAVSISKEEVRAQRLLSDYEKAEFGWFWETDSDGKLTYISETIAESIGKSAKDLIGTKFTSLLSSNNKDDGSGEGKNLSFYLVSRTSFKDLPCRTEGKDSRSWSITGNPIVDKLGSCSGFRGSGRDLSQIKESEHALAQLARYDVLTGLANRTEINSILERSLRDTKGRTKNSAVFLLDLDKFKHVNDTLGHPAGDALLKIVAKRLTKVIGNNGQVGRIGGDEFLVVLPRMTASVELTKLAEQIIRNLSVPYSLEGVQVNIGASVGIAVYEGGDANVDAVSLARDADLALYAAKDAGRGVCRIYEPSMLKKAHERRTLEEELREALNRDQLSIVYQPIIDTSSETLDGFEALLRWEHPTEGFISPETFIGMAEEIDIISQIGEWTIRSACDQVAKWGSDLRIAVNVSPIQFQKPDFVSSVLSCIASSGIEPEQLELEITESVFLDGGSGNVEIFNSLKRVGVRLALDDFGTGYSALGYLQKAPFDKIKIDQSFVKGAAEVGSVNAAIVASIVSLAETLGMDTTAEGAETMKELELVRSLGCSHVQGYVYGKPMSVESAQTYIEESKKKAIEARNKPDREERKITYRAIQVHHDDKSYDCLLRNISSAGAMIDGLTNFSPGRRLLVDICPGLQVEAIVVWISETRIGLKFPDPIDMSEFNRLTAKTTPSALRKAS